MPPVGKVIRLLWLFSKFVYYAAFIASGNYGVSLVHRQNRVHGPGGDEKFPNSPLVNWEFFKRLDLHQFTICDVIREDGDQRHALL